MNISVACNTQKPIKNYYITTLNCPGPMAIHTHIFVSADKNCFYSHQTNKCKINHAMLVHVSRVNVEEHGAKVDTVRFTGQLRWAGQCTNCVQYDFKFTLVYSEIYWLCIMSMNACKS